MGESVIVIGEFGGVAGIAVLTVDVWSYEQVDVEEVSWITGCGCVGEGVEITGREVTTAVVCNVGANSEVDDDRYVGDGA